MHYSEKDSSLVYHPLQLWLHSPALECLINDNYIAPYLMSLS